MCSTIFKVQRKQSYSNIRRHSVYKIEVSCCSGNFVAMTKNSPNKTVPFFHLQVVRIVFLKMNVKPAFSFSIDMKLSEKGVAMGKYDGKNPSLTAITQSNKVSRSLGKLFGKIR